MHVTVLNSELFEMKMFSLDVEYKRLFLKWLDNDLACSTAKWRIVTIHRPFYCSNTWVCSDDSLEKFRLFFEDTFFRRKIDLIISAHENLYERLYPINNKTVDMESVINNSSLYLNPKFPTHIICGTSNSESGIQSKFCNIQIYNRRSN